MVGCVAWVDVFGRGSCSEVEGAESDETTSNFLLGPYDCRGHHVFWCRGRSSAPVDLFVFAAPPRRCPLLFFVLGHRRAAEMVASDDDRKRLTLTRERGRSKCVS
jgi:hypothetical protein